MYEMGEQLERVILAGVQTYESDDTVQSLYELRELAETAGAVTVAKQRDHSSGNLSGKRKAGRTERVVV